MVGTDRRAVRKILRRARPAFAVDRSAVASGRRLPQINVRAKSASSV